MKVLWAMFQTSFSTLGAVLGFFLGGLDGFLYALIAFVAADYITGVLAAIATHQLSSSIGFKGIARKILIFTLVGLANLIDVYVLGETGVLRTAAIFFYISNEGISVLENATRLGLQVPEPLHKALTQLGSSTERTPDDQP